MPVAHSASPRAAYAIIEVVIMAVILSLLATTIVPQYQDATNDANFHRTLFNLQELRVQIECYRQQHDGSPPVTLEHLLLRTDRNGNEGGELGPYLIHIPNDEISNTNQVTASDSSPVEVSGDGGGWLYDPVHGEVRINHASYADL